MVDRALVLTLVIVGFWAMTAGFCIACGASGGLTQAETAKRTYEGEQAACVAVYATAPEIDACRATVRRLWGQPARPSGGGVGGSLLRDGGF